MDFKPLAIRVLMTRANGVQNSGAAESALDKLVRSNTGFDLQELVSEFIGAGGIWARKTRSWLGDGPNEALSSHEVQEFFGSRRLDAFAAALGMSREAAIRHLCDVLPELIDKSSQHGRLLGSANRNRGLAGLASRFLNRVA